VTAINPVPCPELRAVLTPAYVPCASFTGECSAYARWSPSTGHIPRGFVGALGALEEVRLILIVAEPGDPFVTETYPEQLSPDAYISLVCRTAYDALAANRTAFHRNLRYLLDRCWPGEDLDAQLRKTWITESFLCSAARETAVVPRVAEISCARRYLAAQLALLKGRPVITLGGKATQRTAPYAVAINAFAAAPPGGNRRVARPSWDAAAALARRKLGLSEL